MERKRLPLTGIVDADEGVAVADHDLFDRTIGEESTERRTGRNRAPANRGRHDDRMVQHPSEDGRVIGAFDMDRASGARHAMDPITVWATNAAR